MSWNATPQPHQIPTVGRKSGFAIKLHGDHWQAIHVAYIWLKSRGLNTPDIDDLMDTGVPSFEEAGEQGWMVRTFRISAKHIAPLSSIMEEASKLHFKGDFTLRKRAKALKMIDVHDLLADSIR